MLHARPEAPTPPAKPFRALPPIPLRDVTESVELIGLEPARLAALIGAAERHYPRPAIALADHLSRRWLERNANPHLAEIAEVAAALGRPGAYFLNMSYEWACTASVGPALSGQGGRLTRVLDWPFEGLGAQIVAARQHSPAGPWVNLTWPGFTGCIQGHAPRRFSAAFNQAPLRRRSPFKYLDWTLDRLGLWGRRALPPGHLLRLVFETAPDFATARQMLAETPLALPAIFSLVGPSDGEQAVIERLEDRAVVHGDDGAGHHVAANHWHGRDLPSGRPRGMASGHRAEVMRGEAVAAAADLAWLKPPVLNPTTRLALYAEPASGRLVAQGFEAAGPEQATGSGVAVATAITEIPAVKLGELTPGRFLILLAGTVFLIHLGYQAWNDWRLSKPGFHERNCWFDTEVVGGARCGFFTVPENRQDPQTRTIRLPVVVFQAPAEPPPDPEAPVRTPILYLTGGPGGQAYLGPDEVLEVWPHDLGVFPPGHDLVVMGQRGTGLGAPDFECEEFNTPALGWGAFRPGEEPPDYPSLLIEAARACAARLLDAGIDLSAYNSRESAADIAELRLALGIPEWNLYGISYGTRLALSTLRYHPEGIRAVVLDSGLPPEAADLPDTAAFFRRALAMVFADCREDPACTDDYGDLAAAYHEAVAWLSAEPQTIAIDDILTPGERDLLHDLAGLPEGKDLVVSFDHRLLDYLILDALFTTEARGSLPELISETATRQLDTMQRHTGEMMFRYSWYDLSAAVFLSHSCRDEAPFDSGAAVAAAIATAGMQGHIIDEFMAYLLCGDWPSGRAAPVEGTPVHSSVPALLLAGSYDPVTPPALARAAAENLPNGHVFELTEASHGVIYESACARRLLAWFLENLARPPESLCADREIADLPAASKSAEISR